MGKIRVRSRQNPRTKKRAADFNEPAKMRLENFETLLGFKPSLDLLGGDPENKPEMSKNNAPKGIDNPKEDPKQPSAENINQGLSQEEAPDTEVEKIPHEGEKVRQTAGSKKTAEEQNEDLSSPEYQQQVDRASREYQGEYDGSEIPQDEGSQYYSDPVQEAQDEFAEKFMVGSKLADIKIAASLLQESERYSFVNKIARENSLSALESLLSENQTLYESMKSREPREKQASRGDFFIPRTTQGNPPPSSHQDALSSILSGWSKG